MKGLSLTQPWATLIAIGAKRIETRSWSTTYRGPIAIHASKGFPRDCQSLCYQSPFFETLQCGPVILPRGAIVATARLAAVVTTERILELVGAAHPHLPHELAFGDYGPGRFSWVLADVVALPRPIPCTGALGLWTVPPAVIIRLRHSGYAV